MIVPWRSEGGGVGSENLAHIAFEVYGCAEIIWYLY